MRMMNIFKIPLNLTYDEVLPFLGITREASPQERELILYYLKILRQKAQPIGTWQVFAVERHEPERIILRDSPLMIEGPNTAAHFQTCDLISLLAVTLGQKPDHMLSALSKINPAYALILDAVASAGAEYLIEQLDAYLSSEIRHKGYFPTIRFSPGYGDWPLHWQKPFLKSLNAAKIGLTTTPYFVLQPSKSVTAALGWSNVPVKRSYQTTATPSPKACRSANTCLHCGLASTCPDRLQEAEDHTQDTHDTHDTHDKAKKTR